MQPKQIILAALMALSFAGCATVTSGTTQQVYFDTEPTGGICTIERTDGAVLAPNAQMPLVLTVEKDMDALQLTCHKEGYERTTEQFIAGSNNAVWGNLILGGIIGIGVDAMSGAGSKYPSSVVVRLIKK